MEGNKSKPENYKPEFSKDSEENFIRVTDGSRDISSSDKVNADPFDDVLNFELPKEDLETVFGKEVGNSIYNQSLRARAKHNGESASSAAISTVTGKQIPVRDDIEPVIRRSRPTRSGRPGNGTSASDRRYVRDRNERRVMPDSVPAEETKQQKTFRSGQMLKVVEPSTGRNAAPAPTGPANKDNYKQYINKADHRKPIISDSTKKQVRKRMSFLKKNIIGISIVAAVAVIAIVVANMIMSLGSIKAQAVSYSNGIKISWEAVDDAREYQVFKKSDGKWLPMQTTKKLSYTDKKVVNGGEYNYKIRAVNGSRHSKYHHMTTTYYDAVKVTDFSFENMGVTISWKAVSTATGYKVYRSVNGGDNELLETIASGTTTYTDTALEMENEYSYSVVQVVGRVEGALPKKASTISLSSKFDSITASNSPEGVKVTWKGEVPMASGINVYRKVSGGKWTLAGTAAADATEFIDKDNPSFGVKTWYKVAATVNGTEGKAIKTKNYIYTVDPSKKLVALTYDDGPYAPVTNALLDTFEKYNVRATFFIVGDRIHYYTEAVKRAASLDMELASHTYDHKYLTQLSSSEIEYQLSENKKVIEEVSGKEVTLLRPPGGYKVTGIDYPEILWSVDTQDWANRNADTTLANAKAGIYDGSIVLMHDLYPTSAEATASLVPWLINKGYQIVTVSELFEARGIKLENSVSYTQAKKQ